MKKMNANFILILVILAVGVLAYISYEAGYRKSKNDMGSLLMTMSIDSNFVTAGIYEELPNNIKKTMQFYIEDSPTIVNDVKLYAEIKYVTIGNEVMNIDNGKLWNIIKRENIFQRQFEEDNSCKERKDNPNSSLVENRISDNQIKNIL